LRKAYCLRCDVQAVRVYSWQLRLHDDVQPKITKRRLA
jgi:hypothetical protein